MKTEMIENMSFEDYAAVDACHKSALKHVQTGKHLKAFQDDPLDTDALRFGKIFHEAIFDDEFAAGLEVYSEQEWLAKKDHPEGLSVNDQKAQWKDEREFYFLNETEKEAIDLMVKSVRDNPLAKKYIEAEGSNEVSLFWNDEKTGLPCKTRLDRLLKNDVAVEVKTDADPSPEAFGRKAYNMGYQVGAWFNREGFRAVTGRDLKAFIFIVIEKKAPYAVAVYMMSEHDFDSGEIYGYPLMKRYQLIKRGGLRDYNQGESGEYEVLALATPGWELRIVEDELSEIDAPYEDEGDSEL